MPQNNFARNVTRGNVGERFFADHILELVQNPDAILNLRDRAGEYVEGGDFSAHTMVLGDEVESFLPEFAGVIDIGGRTAYEVKDYTIGGIEVKTDWGFLFRTNDSEEPYGTLPFALWSNESRENYGWLLRIMYPDRFYTEGEEIHSVQPMILPFVLAAYQNVYACIVFENVAALRERLVGIAAEAGVDLVNGIPLGEAAVDWQPEGLLIDGALWYVQLSKLEDLATVTMIGERPRIRPDIEAGAYRCSSLVQNQRYDHLIALAEGRDPLPADDNYKDAFTPAAGMEVFANIDKNLDIIEHIDPEKYPVLYYYSRQRVFRHLEGLMWNMLSKAYPFWPKENPAYFAISNGYLENWCKDHGIGGSSKSIQGSLMFLRIIGLVKTFRAGPNVHDPILESVMSRIKYIRGSRNISLRTVPLYTEDVLLSADQLAKEFYDKKINISKMTKTDVIQVLGQEAADRYYMSSTKVSSVEAYVDEVCFDVLWADIETRGYALFDEVMRKAKQVVYDDTPLEHAPWEPDFTAKERAAFEQMGKYDKAFHKFEERKKAKAEQQGLVYRQIRKEDREAMSIPPEVKSWIFTKR